MTTPHTTPAPERGRTPEKTAWWLVFGFLILSIFVMVGLWN